MVVADGRTLKSEFTLEQSFDPQIGRHAAVVALRVHDSRISHRGENDELAVVESLAQGTEVETDLAQERSARSAQR